MSSFLIKTYTNYVIVCCGCNFQYWKLPDKEVPYRNIFWQKKLHTIPSHQGAPWIYPTDWAITHPPRHANAMATETATVAITTPTPTTATATRTTRPGCALQWWRWRQCRGWGGERDGNGTGDSDRGSRRGGRWARRVVAVQCILF